MKSRYQFIVGVLVGATLFGGATAYAAGVVAEPTWQPIYVDGARVQMEAYNINGSNYVRLRDIGQAVGFNVYWENGVQVDSDAPYTGEAPASMVSAAEEPASQPNDIAALRRRVTDLTNEVRRQKGLGPLGTDAMLSQAAQVRAEEMAAASLYSHTRPDGTKWTTVSDCPYIFENIHRIADWQLEATGETAADFAVREWAASPEHLKNLLRTEADRIGVGLARGVNASGDDCWYCVQLFLWQDFTITWVDDPAHRS